MTKIVIICAALFFSQQGFACIHSGQFSVCSGDTVFKGDIYSRGAVVLGLNLYHKSASVQSNNNGEIHEENIADLDFTKGCVDHLCVGAKVYKGSDYSRGGTVLAVNPIHRTATVKSVNNGELKEEQIADLARTRGCLFGVCVGDKIYKGETYSHGGIVRATNFRTRLVIVESINNRELNVEDPRDLDLINACDDYGNEIREKSKSLSALPTILPDAPY